MTAYRGAFLMVGVVVAALVPLFLGSRPGGLTGGTTMPDAAVAVTPTAIPALDRERPAVTALATFAVG